MKHKVGMKFLRLHSPYTEIALSIKAMAILLPIIAIYLQDLLIVANEAIRSELMSHILATPFPLAYLVYRKRKMLRATIPFETTNPTRKPIYTREIVGALPQADLLPNHRRNVDLFLMIGCFNQPTSPINQMKYTHI